MYNLIYVITSLCSYRYMLILYYSCIYVRLVDLILPVGEVYKCLVLT
jgi:hypothetical protein